MDDQKKRIKQKLELQDLKSQKQYFQLINFLKPFGKHQIKLYLITAMYWFLAGMLKTMFQIIYQQPTANLVLDIGQFLGLLISSFVAQRYGRKKTISVLTVFMLLGTIIMIFLNQISIGVVIGIFLIGLSHYTTVCLLIGIISEYLPCGYSSMAVVIYLIIFVIGKIIAVPIAAIFNDSTYHASLFLLLPISLLYFIGNVLVYESPRYLLDNNMLSAQNLIHKISQTNQCDEQALKYRLNDSFILKRINIVKYNYKTFVKYRSLKYPTYCLLISFFCLGIVGKCPSFVMKMQADNDPSYTKSVEVFWICCFQLGGLIAGSFGAWVSNRLYIIFPLSFLSSLIMLGLYLLHLNLIFKTTPLLFDLAFLGLNATMTITLYAFLFINAVEYYSHTVRVMGLGIMMSMYYLGQIVQNFQRQFLDKDQWIMEMYLLASFVIIVHIIGLKETFRKPMKYQIKEIQEQEQENY